MDKSGILFGYSTLSADEIRAAIDSGQAVDRIHGDLVVSGWRDGGEYLVSSFLSARPYYCALSVDGLLVHGDSVFEVARKAAIPWAWSNRSIESLALFGHTVGSDTLCHGVYRIPAATKVSAMRGRLVVEPLKI